MVLPKGIEASLVIYGIQREGLRNCWGTRSGSSSVFRFCFVLFCFYCSIKPQNSQFPRIQAHPGMTGTSSLPSPRSSAQANNSTWAPSTCACEASTARLRIRPPLSSSTAATVITCLDWCSSLLTGLPALSLPHYSAVPKWCSKYSLQMVNPCSKPSTD